jgi:hypothetical protein
MTVQIYSLRRPPKLLRTITGGSFFSTADTDLDGQIEIWTKDAAALDGFESGRTDWRPLAPAVVLRFVRGRLLDVSSEFQSYFDEQIAAVRGTLDPEDLREFKNSSGRLAPTAHFSVEDLRQSDRLQHTKERVLQIIWAYLYSGREQQAWNALAEFWPSSDAERIRAAIFAARAQGVRAQIDGISTKASSGAQKMTPIFDARSMRPPQSGMRLAGRSLEEKGMSITPPVPIWVGRLILDGQPQESLAESGMLLDLTIDSAGKVRSAESTDALFDSSLKSSTASWKFIPAFKDRQAIASRIYLIISPKQ